MKDQTRNLNPHKEAIVAMALYNHRYAQRGSGSMDFYDSLSEGEKTVCRDIVKRLENARRETPEEMKK
jgi:hypothetical protein